MSKARGRRSSVGKVRSICIDHLLASEFNRLIVDALKDSIKELRKDDEARISRYVYIQLSEWHILIQYCYRITTTFQEELSAFRAGEEKRFSR